MASQGVYSPFPAKSIPSPNKKKEVIWPPWNTPADDVDLLLKRLSEYFISPLNKDEIIDIQRCRK